MWDGVGVESKIECVGEVCETEAASFAPFQHCCCCCCCCQPHSTNVLPAESGFPAFDVVSDKFYEYRRDLCV